MMTVIAMDVAPENIRGEMTRWFLEIKPGVFIGDVNVRIRDLLWERFANSHDVRGAVMAYTSNNEQGYEMRLAGMPKREIVNLDGIKLVKIKH